MMSHYLRLFAGLILLLPTLAFSSGESTSAKTKYPIVMVGGATAFDSIQLGIFNIDYWFKITDALRRNGADVSVTNISGAQSNEKRNEELLRDIERIIELKMEDPDYDRIRPLKVNIIAHSQGALAARYVASQFPELVSSVTTYAGMNRGTHISPWARQTADAFGFTSGSEAEAFLENFASFIIKFLFDWDVTGRSDGDYNSPETGEQSLLLLEQATAPAMVEMNFNRLYPEGLPNENCMNIKGGRRGDVKDSTNHVVNGVHYYSVGSNSNALPTTAMEVVDAIWGGMVVPLSVAVVAPHDLFYKWDGLVPQCGQKLGKFIGFWNMNHFDAVGHFVGIRPSFVNSLYTDQANRLKNAGL